MPYSVVIEKPSSEERVQNLAKLIQGIFPNGKIKVDRPVLLENGYWWIDINNKDDFHMITYSPQHGWGLSNVTKDKAMFGMGADEVFGFDDVSILKRLLEISKEMK